MKLTWSYRRFEDLHIDLLYDLLKLRTDIFVVEQNCPYPEIDNLDKQAIHLTGFHENELIAYARIFEPGVIYPEACIGRVAVSQFFRSKKYGYELMRTAMEYCAISYPESGIKIAAQTHLAKFYGRFGFVQSSVKYLLDGIWHIDMKA